MIDLLPNATVVVQWVIFMMALVTLHFGIFRPILHLLEERKNRTEGEKETAETLEKKTVEISDRCGKRLEEARLEGSRKKEEIRGAGEKQVEEILKRTRAEMDKRLSETRQTIDKEVKEASFLLRQQARDLSKEIASKILGREV